MVLIGRARVMAARQETNNDLGVTLSNRLIEKA
jgi:hypothetical protein